jgi:3D (Asp-Asp-Asp) domain-containing protein
LNRRKIILIGVLIFLIGFFIGFFMINVRGETLQAKTDLNIRQLMSTDAEIIKVIPEGAEVDVYYYIDVDEKTWARVKYQEYNGYCVSKYLKEVVIKKDENNEEMISLGTWHITAYTHTGYNCANGNYPTAGYTVAQNSMNFGTKIYIEGIGYRTVEDRGPGYLGTSWCDVFMDSYSECVQFGSQYREVFLCE